METEGKSICFTGKLRNFTRNQARAMVVCAGMDVYEAVKARRYGVCLVSEDDFMAAMGLDRGEVETDTVYRKAHPAKKQLDWKACLDAICRRLGLSYSKRTEPVWRRGKDEKLVRIQLRRESPPLDLGVSSDLFCLKEFEGSPVEWTNDDKYVADDEAYRHAVWMLGTKAFRTPFYYSERKLKALKDFASSYPSFGMPVSTAELKLKLECLGWSIT